MIKSTVDFDKAVCTILQYVLEHNKYPLVNKPVNKDDLDLFDMDMIYAYITDNKLTMMRKQPFKDDYGTRMNNDKIRLTREGLEFLELHFSVLKL